MSHNTIFKISILKFAFAFVGKNPQEKQKN